METLWNNWRSLQINWPGRKTQEGQKTDAKVRINCGAFDAIEESQNSSWPKIKKKSLVLQDQQGPRQSVMSGNDKFFCSKDNVTSQGSILHLSLRHKRFGWSQDVTEDITTETGSSNPSSEFETSSQSEKKSATVPPNLTRHILTAFAVAEIADRFNLSNNQVMQFFEPINIEW